jgi:hypothetical protein
VERGRPIRPSLNLRDSKFRERGVEFRCVERMAGSIGAPCRDETHSSWPDRCAGCLRRRARPTGTGRHVGPICDRLAGRGNERAPRPVGPSRGRGGLPLLAGEESLVQECPAQLSPSHNHRPRSVCRPVLPARVGTERRSMSSRPRVAMLASVSRRVPTRPRSSACVAPRHRLRRGTRSALSASTAATWARPRARW